MRQLVSLQLGQGHEGARSFTALLQVMLPLLSWRADIELTALI